MLKFLGKLGNMFKVGGFQNSNSSGDQAPTESFFSRLWSCFWPKDKVKKVKNEITDAEFDELTDQAIRNSLQDMPVEEFMCLQGANLRQEFRENYLLEAAYDLEKAKLQKTKFLEPVDNGGKEIDTLLRMAFPRLDDYVHYSNGGRFVEHPPLVQPRLGFPDSDNVTGGLLEQSSRMVEENIFLPVLTRCSVLVVFEYLRNRKFYNAALKLSIRLYLEKWFKK